MHEVWQYREMWAYCLVRNRWLLPFLSCVLTACVTTCVPHHFKTSTTQWRRSIPHLSLTPSRAQLNSTWHELWMNLDPFMKDQDKPGFSAASVLKALCPSVQETGASTHRIISQAHDFDAPQGMASCQLRSQCIKCSSAPSCTTGHFINNIYCHCLLTVDRRRQSRLLFNSIPFLLTNISPCLLSLLLHLQPYPLLLSILSSSILFLLCSPPPHPPHPLPLLHPISPEVCSSSISSASVSGVSREG